MHSINSNVGFGKKVFYFLWELTFKENETLKHYCSKLPPTSGN
jgi:hypothetical protein